MVAKTGWGLLAVGAALAFAPPPAAAAPHGGAKYFIRVAETEETAGLQSGLVEDAKKFLELELSKRPELVLSLAPATPADPDQLAVELKKRNLKGYKVFVRLTAVTTETLPPRPGRPYKQMQATVRAAIIGVSLPGEVMALSGDGEASAATEYNSARPPKDAEILQLKREALGDALSQGVEKALAKLAQGFMVPPAEKRRPKK